jgi:hypothetical protein
MRRVALLVAALVVAACTGEPSEPAPVAVQAADRPSLLEPGAFPPRRAPQLTSPPVVASAVPAATAPVRVEVVRLAAAQGEDGHGHVVRAARPAAIDLVSERGWHAGGLATTLTVGDLRFYDMGYPTITTMRFLVADEATLPRDVEVALEVGGSPARRRVLAPSLPLAGTR